MAEMEGALAGLIHKPWEGRPLKMLAVGAATAPPKEEAGK